MKPNEKKIWFPAKRYGWGWGIPCAWQGWVVLIVWLLLLWGGTFLVREHPVFFITYTLVLSVALIVICYRKGEKPKWRWGKD